jgi:hypothetical protein
VEEDKRDEGSRCKYTEEEVIRQEIKKGRYVAKEG